LEFATSPEHGTKRVQIWATPEKIWQIQNNVKEAMQLEKMPERPKQQWQQEEDLLEEQCKWQSVHHGLMAPSGEALKHLAVEMLVEFLMKGCPVKTGPQWMLEILEAALQKGAHPSAMDLAGGIATAVN
jgi:hypothetical protein